MRKIGRFCVSLLALAGLQAQLGCGSDAINANRGSGGVGQSGGSGGTGPDATGGSGGQTGAGGQAGGVGSGGQAGSKGGGGSTTSTGGSTSTCVGDLPCEFAYQCTGRGYHPVATGDCHRVCGPGPCSGASCEPTGPEVACPAGTRCVGVGSDDVTRLCQPIDAGVADTGTKDAATVDAGPVDSNRADLPLKDPIDTPECSPGANSCQGRSLRTCDTEGRWKTAKTCPYACSDGACVGDCAPGDYRCDGVDIQKCNSTGAWEFVATCPDACTDAICVESCSPGDRRCKDLVPQTCSSESRWQNNQACLYLCSNGTCKGECTPGSLRCRGTTTQLCSADAAWVDQQACTGTSPICASGQCVSACLDASQDCTDPKTSCCQGNECVSSDGGTTFSCRAVAACAASGTACTANADCCAGLDCTSGKCAARAEGCREKPTDGTCLETAIGTCCPGTVCAKPTGSSPAVCSIPTETRPQDRTCLRDRPSNHEPCSAARFGLTCTYSDWAKEPGVFYVCTCSYHGWSCEKNYYV